MPSGSGNAVIRFDIAALVMGDSKAHSDQPKLREQGYEPLEFWVITKAPRDLPEWPYVARKWESGKPTDAHYRARALDTLRLWLRREERCELCIGRDETDDPVIVETWL
jgi:hypothetical protein